MEEALEQAQHELVRSIAMIGSTAVVSIRVPLLLSLSRFSTVVSIKVPLLSLYQGSTVVVSIKRATHVLAFCGRYGSFGSVL